jgi:hypothetical protein
LEYQGRLGYKPAGESRSKIWNLYYAANTYSFVQDLGYNFKQAGGITSNNSDEHVSLASTINLPKFQWYVQLYGNITQSIINDPNNSYTVGHPNDLYYQLW